MDPLAVQQLGFRWAGEANIALAIEPIVSLGNVLRMVPKVSNLRVRFRLWAWCWRKFFLLLWTYSWMVSFRNKTSAT